MTKAVVRKLGIIMKQTLSSCTREQFIDSITPAKEDKFAKTFVSKADMQDNWDKCIGCFDDSGELMGAIITTFSKRSPVVANLQLLHTFAKHRRKGVARKLTLDSIDRSFDASCQYYRVSSEPESVGFYESIGFKFWGLQKSGCSLSIFRLSYNDRSMEFDDKDPVIHSALYSGRKGSLASSYETKENSAGLHQWITD